MNTFFQFANNYPGWAVALVLFAIYIPCRYAWKFWVMHNRHKNIAARGWPPPHLDADGDSIAESYEEGEERDDDDPGISISVQKADK